MPMVRTASGKLFDVADGESLLDGALRSDVVLAYSCRTGRCGTCRGRLAAGTTFALHDEIGLTDLEKDGGWILTCVRSAQSDLELEIDDLCGVSLSPARTVPFRISFLRKVTNDIVIAGLRLPQTVDFKFYPGQYVDIIGAGGVRRSYSIANAPAANAQIELHIRRVDGGMMSRYWFEQAKVDDLLRLYGPLGTFFLRDPGGLDLVFLATGTGIAPVKAILEGLSRDMLPRPRSVSIYWGGRVPDDFYWDPDCLGIALRFVPVLSQNHKDWSGARGYVQTEYMKGVPTWDDSVVYACGSESMILSARDQLIRSGLSSRRFFSDAFVCSAAT